MKSWKMIIALAAARLAGGGCGQEMLKVHYTDEALNPHTMQVRKDVKDLIFDNWKANWEITSLSLSMDITSLAFPEGLSSWQSAPTINGPWKDITFDDTRRLFLRSSSPAEFFRVKPMAEDESPTETQQSTPSKTPQQPPPFLY